MTFSKTAVFLSAIGAASHVAAHGTVSGIVANGKYFEGYSPSFQFESPPPVVVGWSIPEDLSNGFISPENYTNPDIICHLAATPAQTQAPVVAGSKVSLEWTPWPSSHHGPVIDYLANCNGPCENVDKTKLQFVKIDGVGLINDATVPGIWASDQLIANNNSWTVTIPASIAPGNYVLRHEIIALHSAETVGGAQNYPQCVNLQVTGSGTDQLATGTLGEDLYTETDPGIEINIYQSLASYVVPGPPLYSGAVFVTQGSNASTTAISGVSTTPTPSVASTAPMVSATSVPATTAILAPTAAPANASTLFVTASPTSSKKIKTPCSTATPVANTTSAVTPIVQPVVSASSLAASSAVQSIASAVSAIASALPSGALTASLPSLPVPSASGGLPIPSGISTSSPIPSGATLLDLLEWLEIIIAEMMANQQQNGLQRRTHPRHVRL
ncbi:hypothetical protein MMC20_004503 [Loxospora ochrophaea]|nr:hypothetical protein [Loxospora ochrophaea]